jgi:fatty acyl-CoA reductase
VLVTGATGCLGQALLERLLVSYPTTRVTLLVRGRGGSSGRDRVAALLRRPIFETGRAAAAERVEVIDAELGGGAVSLPGDLTAVIHAASTVSFDPPIDQAFRTNVQGVVDLYEAVLEAGGRPHVVHVSTAYVNGIHRGRILERALAHTVDWRAELAAARAARPAAEADSRSPAVLRRVLAQASRTDGKAGPRSTAVAAEDGRRAWVDRQLVEQGRLRARVAGWTDVYTFTKALGERAAEDLLTGLLPLSIVRPAILESAWRHPYPGWIDGFKMADPLIVAYGRGLLRELPGRPDGILDLIPVDLVVNAILAAATKPPSAPEPSYYHAGSGGRNPLTVLAMYDNLRQYFTDHPMPDGGRGHIIPPTWTFPDAARADRILRTAERVLGAAQDILLSAPATVRGWQDGLTRQREKLDTLRRFADLYGVYVQTEAICRTDRLLALHRDLPADRVAEHGFDPADLDWQHYLQRIHFPAVTRARRRIDARRRAGKPQPPRVVETVGSAAIAVFDLEGTLVGANAVETYLQARLCDLPRHRWPAELGDLVRRMPRYLRAEHHDRGEFLRAFLRRFQGADEAALRRLVIERLGDTLLRRAHPEAIRQVRRHRAAGHRTVLITGTIDVLVGPVAALFDETLTSRLQVRGGRYTGFLEEPPPVGEARAEWLRQYANAAGADLSLSYAYGDSFSDRTLLEAVGNPVAVNPDPRLYRHASQRRWPVVDWTAKG